MWDENPEKNILFIKKKKLKKFKKSVDFS